MYSPYGAQAGYGQQQQPPQMQQQRTGFQRMLAPNHGVLLANLRQAQSSFGQQQGYGSQQVPQQSNYGNPTGQMPDGGQMGSYGMQQGSQQQNYPRFEQQNTFIPQQAYMVPQQTGYVQQSTYNGAPAIDYQQYGGTIQQNSNGFQGFNNLNMATTSQHQPSQSQQPFQPQTSANNMPAAPKLKQQKTGANIPPTRLSFVQAADQQKFEVLFAKAVGPYNTALPGDEAKTILMKSGLKPDQLSRIWAMSDTTRSGQLLFPEFVLAMHLCNQALRRGIVPDRLDDKVRNEVNSMVDHIAFTAADTIAAPSMQTITTAPSFTVPQEQQQLSNVSLMAQQMEPAQMGFYNAAQSLSSQQTGYSQMAPQQTGYPQQMLPQPTGYSYMSGLQPGLTGVQQPGVTGSSFLQPQQMQTQANPGFQFPTQALMSQPTGRPGEWGFVRAPQGSVQGMQALGAAMMPGAAPMQGGFQMSQRSNVELPWAITKEEKAIYDTIFQAWDKKRQGFVDGPVAIEVFGSSGVERCDLELVWALADADDKGKLNGDEFAVALHLIYRKLNGYEIPPVLPPELIPPATRNFGDSISQVKTMLQQDASSRNGPTSYMKNRSFKDDNANRDYSKDGTVYKHNDSDVGYVSSSRRRGPASSSEQTQPSKVSAKPPTDQNGEYTLSELKKLIKEKQVLLDAIDDMAPDLADENRNLDAQARRESDELLRQIRKAQTRLDAHQNAHLLNSTDDQEKTVLHRRLQALVDNLPEIASKVRNIERRIQEVQLEVWTKQDQKAHPGSGMMIGTGPGGQVTEADKRRAKTKAMMAARTAALTGRPAPKSSDDDFETATRRQAEKNSELSKTREVNEQMIKDIEESAESLRADIESALDASKAVAGSEHERRRWNDAVGVEPEVRDFIRELNKNRQVTAAHSSQQAAQDPKVVIRTVDQSSAAPSRSTTPTYNTFNATEDRASYLKQAAEARMAERLAALGIRPSKKSNRDSPSFNAEIIKAADPPAREEVMLAEQAKQLQERQTLEEKTRQEESALAEAQRKQQEELKRVEEERRSGEIHAKEVERQKQAASKPVDSRQAKLAQLRAEREARLAEEERLERELAAEDVSSDSGDEGHSTPRPNPFGAPKAPANTVQSSRAAEFEVVSTTETRTGGTNTASGESNNPFHKLGQAQQSQPPAQPSPIFRPPSAAPPSTQRTSAPRTKPVRKHSDDWSNASKDDESSSDEEGPSPADLAARLFSGGMVPQRTGGVQTPLTSQRTGAASSPAPSSGPPPPPRMSTELSFLTQLTTISHSTSCTYKPCSFTAP